MEERRIIISSKEALSESIRLSSQSEEEIATEYLNYPVLPINCNIRIDKIGIINFNALTKQTLGKICYGTFRKLNPDLFCACKDPHMDYEDHDQVTPVLIISGDTKYRVHQTLWFPLSDILGGILTRQGSLRKKLFPIEVFIDDNNQWIVPLFNLTGGNF